MISIICACNNEELFNSMLLPSIEKQTVQDYEIIKLNAKELGTNGAAQTLNHGANIAKGDLLMFVHQDVELADETFLKKLLAYSAESDFGIAGVAGVIAGGKCLYTSITHGKDHKDAGIKSSVIKPVDTLDECLFIIKKEKFKGFTDYGTWHFYAVEYSLRCKTENEKVLLFPLEIYHLSSGLLPDKSYWQTLKKVAKDFSEFKIIPTTVGQFRNSHLLWLYIIYKKARSRLDKRIKH